MQEDVSMTKTSEAQKRATQEYRKKNREKTRIQSAKSAAKTFIRKYAQVEDLKELKQLIDSKMADLENNK